MDPLTAISLAGNVCAFIDVALDIVSQTSEISSSLLGTSDHIANLETVHQKLADCCSKLSSTADALALPEWSLASEIEAVKDLAQECEKDCVLLLTITSRLRLPRGRKSKWESLRVAIQTLLTSKETERLESRLKRTQSTLSLHICSITA
jgi:hypothetical protein